MQAVVEPKTTTCDACTSTANAPAPPNCGSYGVCNALAAVDSKSLFVRSGTACTGYCATYDNGADTVGAAAAVTLQGCKDACEYYSWCHFISYLDDGAYAGAEECRLHEVCAMPLVVRVRPA